MDLGDLTVNELTTLESALEIALARTNFWDYCRLRDPEFYQDKYSHLKTLCLTLNNFYFGLPLDSTGKIYRNLMINMPPQHGKTRTAIHFVNWCHGRNKKERIITGSYNDSTAEDFSKYTRDNLTQDKFDPDTILVRDIFPHLKLKPGTSSAKKWALMGEHFNYLGAGIGGSVTSKGATMLIVDDLVKGALEALSDNYLDRAWQFYADTLASRRSAEQLDHGLLKIMIMTRWSKDDPCGRVLEKEPGKWHVVSMPACDYTTKTMLCPDFLSYDDLMDIRDTMAPEIFAANYDNQPMDIQGALYPVLKTWDKLPMDDQGRILLERRRCYVDTADQGNDWTCAIIWGDYQGRAYVLDVYFTPEGMEITEPELARRVNKFQVHHCRIESNAGGQGFFRNVRRLAREQTAAMKPPRKCTTIFRSFHQSENKAARIVSNSTNVMENVFFPVDWMTRWPEFHRHVTRMVKEKLKQANVLDDGVDCLTGVAESLGMNQMEIMK